MNRITDELKFWQASSAAEEIFRYRRENPDVRDMPWGFDHGFISDDKTIVTAVFSCTSITGWGKDELHVSAKQSDGKWVLSHTIDTDGK